MSSDPSAVPAREERKSLLDKIGPAVAVGLTALAAVFGSMSAAALQQAMYWKSQAAQDQSKSTNQWTLAGFKRDRALIMQATAAQMRAASGYVPAAFAAPPALSATADEAQKKAHELLVKAHGWLTELKGDKAGPPRVNLPEISDPAIKELRDAIERREPEADQLAKAAKVDKAAINQAIDELEKAVEQVDKDWDPVVKAAARLVEGQVSFKADGDDDRRKKAGLAAAAQAVGFEMEQRRYRAESFFNQSIGFLYDVRVKVSTAESDRHRKKSQTLGYAMLVAQIGAVAASLALSRRKGFSLWLVAGAIGVVAIGFGGYAFLPASLLGG
ncbi:MAG: hypothetical protein C0501_02875 [Isosphaera sp.]|nr:hypothetical protein [Isosphaera sp.]